MFRVSDPHAKATGLHACGPSPNRLQGGFREKNPQQCANFVSALPTVWKKGAALAVRKHLSLLKLYTHGKKLGRGRGEVRKPLMMGPTLAAMPCSIMISMKDMYPKATVVERTRSIVSSFPWKSTRVNHAKTAVTNQ